MGRSFVKAWQVWMVLGGVALLAGVAVQPAFADATACAAATASASSSTASGAEAGPAEAEIDLNTPVPNYWPLPEGCKKMVPAGGAACEGCCRTTVNTWLSPWCWQHTKPGPERDQCHQDATNWYIWCMEDCAAAGASNQSNPSYP
jgi:hypothetical protein